jgi:hypothetical protein
VRGQSKKSQRLTTQNSDGEELSLLTNKNAKEFFSEMKGVKISSLAKTRRSTSRIHSQSISKAKDTTHFNQIFIYMTQTNIKQGQTSQ